MRIAKVALLLDHNHGERYWGYGLNVFEAYIAEILSHAGMPFEWLYEINELDNSRFDVAIVALVEETADTAELLWRFADNGGIVISYAGLNHLQTKLGCCEQPSVARGYAILPDMDGNGRSDAAPLRFLHARPWLVAVTETGRDAAQLGALYRERPDGEPAGAALLKFNVGRGCIDRWSINIPYTVVGLQQGTKPVLEDGVPAPDFSANLNEGTLKADDQSEMDWEWDRVRTESGMPYFAHPYADLWREAAIAHLLQRVVEAGLTLPFVGYWPEGVDAVALISHDSDGNEDDQAEAMLKTLRSCGVQSTWCMLEPGYSADLYAAIKAEGHELAFHYNALELDTGFWDEQEFNRQLNGLKRAADLAEVVSNKNHYTRFEGWGQLFEWCERAGVSCDQTRGPSKRGNVGFLFGTCHPYFPIAWGSDRNRLYNVLEIGFLTQDIELPGLADSSIVKPFLERVRRVEGVAHFLFHQQYAKDAAVAGALRNVVHEARRQGFVFWTSKQINDWERARRTLKMTGMDDNGDILLTGDAAAGDAVVWIPVDSRKTGEAAETCVRFGVPCVRRQARLC